MIQIAPRSQLTLALATECIHCGGHATATIECGDYRAAVCAGHRPTQRQIDELAALDGVRVTVREIEP